MRLRDEEGFVDEGRLDGFEDRVSPETGTVRVRAILRVEATRFCPGCLQSSAPFGPPRPVLEVPGEAISTARAEYPCWWSTTATLWKAKQ